jgi:hypothetical protein
MLNPETNVVTPYEEVWRALPASFADQFGYAWILRSKDKRTFLAQVGGDFLALKGGDEGPVGAKGFCARRENWDSAKGCWAVYLEAGESKNLPSLPSLAAMKEKDDVTKQPAWVQTGKEGDEVEFLGDSYVLCALEKAT